MNESSLYSGQGFFKPGESSGNKDEKIKEKSAAPAEALDKKVALKQKKKQREKENKKNFTPISYLEKLCQLNQKEKNTKVILERFRSKYFYRAFVIEDEKIFCLIKEVIQEYLDDSAIVYYLLQLCFNKYAKNKHPDDETPYHAAVILLIGLIMDFFDDTRDKAEVFKIISCINFFKELLIKIVNHDQQPNCADKKVNLDKISENIVLIEGMFFAFGKIKIAERDIFKSAIIYQLETCLDYQKFLQKFYLEGNAKISFEKEVMAYMVSQTLLDEAFELDLLEDNYWRDIYISHYGTFPKVQPENYKKFYQIRMEAEWHYLALIDNKDCLDEMPESAETIKILHLMLKNLHRVGDMNAGFMLVELALNAFANTKGTLVSPVPVSKAQKVLRKLSKQSYQMRKDHPWVEAIPDYINIIKKRLDEHQSEVMVSFTRGEDVSGIIDILRNLYSIGSRAAGLMLVKLATEYYEKTNESAYHYPINFEEASKIFNGSLLKNYDPEKRQEALDVINEIQNEILPDTDDEAEDVEAGSSTESDEEDPAKNAARIAELSL